MTEKPTRQAFLWLDLGETRRVGAVRWLQAKGRGAVEI